MAMTSRRVPPLPDSPSPTGEPRPYLRASPLPSVGTCGSCGTNSSQTEAVRPSSLKGRFSTFILDPWVQKVPFASELRDRRRERTQVERAGWAVEWGTCIREELKDGWVSWSLAALLKALIGSYKHSHVASEPPLGF